MDDDDAAAAGQEVEMKNEAHDLRLMMIKSESKFFSHERKLPDIIVAVILATNGKI